MIRSFQLDTIRRAQTATAVALAARAMDGGRGELRDAPPGCRHPARGRATLRYDRAAARAATRGVIVARPAHADGSQSHGVGRMVAQMTSGMCQRCPVAHSWWITSGRPASTPFLS